MLQMRKRSASVLVGVLRNEEMEFHGVVYLTSLRIACGESKLGVEFPRCH